MKSHWKLSVMLVLLLAILCGCQASDTAEKTNGTAPDEIIPVSTPEILTPEEALQQLKDGNQTYCDAVSDPADISLKRREDTAENGQHPYAVIVTCSDSRVPPEHIFSAGVGDLFIIRTAGNVISDFELGSIEYGAEHLHAKTVVVLGHSGCGAVEAALGGDAEGSIQNIVEEIRLGLGTEAEHSKAENLNITHSKEHIMESEIIRHLVDEGNISVIEAKYNIKTGEAEFF